jgi:hypothetical protein
MNCPHSSPGLGRDALAGLRFRSSALNAPAPGPAARRARRRRLAALLGFVVVAWAGLAGLAWHFGALEPLPRPVPLSAELPAVALSEALDYVQRLPATPDVPAAVALLQAAAGRAEVGLVGLAISRAAPATPALERLLGRTELQATLRGPYAGLRDVLAQMSGPESAAVLRALSIRRIGATGELEAQVTWWLPSRPA